jgi:uracil-DNA glycosylase
VSAEDYLPERRSITALRSAAAGCRGCDLWEDATQTVFGEGRVSANLVILGEQPGDHEAQEGHVFVGPAGHLLWQALAESGIDRSDVYATNIVKHFRWEYKGKRRIHKTPTRMQVVACQPWFAAELRALSPKLLLVLGSVAAAEVFGNDFRVTRQRGKVVPGPNNVPSIATVHPSAVLRAPERQRTLARRAFTRDLDAVRTFLDEA